ncbi:hypothetical protein CONPUDRAFT_151013 [Coniophora puteana RWD-64-598 SS2]|uniref:Uncharacterized protein n=1 Tax=Coniophora puteana (strain RWD-64-598) TaxID=741705 RepID=A0A5M3MY55_CONPW|nr:uncharacterized protein CONPUDRAFT_151013 [Coniophora puteana RWD-64-598 SS2]EIW83966.1 hypothetical protein CONPUDRAFT_151013 [Coniophora puteana RWD-64-598 SS2]
MCHLVYPVCVCTECHLEKPVFTPEDIRDSMLRSRMECDTDDDPRCSDVKQDCWSRHCAHSKSHAKHSDVHCLFTCKQRLGEALQIPGGNAHFVCHDCKYPKDDRRSYQSSRTGGYFLGSGGPTFSFAQSIAMVQ